MASSPDSADQPSRSPARRRILDLVGLAARAGAIIAGTDAVRAAAREDQVRRVILAEDAAAGQQGKLTPLLDARRVPYHTLFSRSELGAAIGRGAVSAIAITDSSFAKRTGELVDTLSEDRFTA